MSLVQSGFDPDWLLDLDLLAFDQLIETSMKTSSQHRLEDMLDQRVTAHGDVKEFKKQTQILRKLSLTGNDAPDGDNLVSDLTRLGAIK